MAGFVQAIGLDLDGTLAQGSMLSDEAISAAAAVRERGIAVVLVTGRILCELQREFPDLQEKFDAVDLGYCLVTYRPDDLAAGTRAAIDLTLNVAGSRPGAAGDRPRVRPRCTARPGSRRD